MRKEIRTLLAYELAMMHRTPSPAAQAFRDIQKSSCLGSLELYPDKISAEITLPYKLTPRNLNAAGHQCALGDARVISLNDLSDILLGSVGLIGGNLSLRWGGPPSSQCLTNLRYTRGTPSAGGLYPSEVYIAAQRVAAIPSGVYRYDAFHHSLLSIRRGKVARGMARATLDCHIDREACILIITSRWQRTALKYRSLAFKNVLFDAGSVIECVVQIAHSLSLLSSVSYCFRDDSITEMLRVSAEEELPVGIVAISPTGCSDETVEDVLNLTDRAPEPDEEAFRISMKPATAPVGLNDINTETLALYAASSTSKKSPAFSSLSASSPGRPEAINAGRGEISGSGMSLVEALRRRHSAWGRLRREPPLTHSSVMNILLFCTQGDEARSKAFDYGNTGSLLDLFVLAESVEGISPGTYEYSAKDNLLREIGGHSDVRFRQGDYFLRNYSIDQVSMVLVIAGRLKYALSTVGPRGMRVMNMKAGCMLERAYIACAAHHVGCGAVLGFDAPRIAALCHMSVPSMIPLLLVLCGHEVGDVRAFDFRTA